MKQIEKGPFLFEFHRAKIWRQFELLKFVVEVDQYLGSATVYLSLMGLGMNLTYVFNDNSEGRKVMREYAELGW